MLNQQSYKPKRTDETDHLYKELVKRIGCSNDDKRAIMLKEKTLDDLDWLLLAFQKDPSLQDENSNASKLLQH